MAAARSFLSCQPDPDQENTQYTTHGILAQVKCNLAPLGPSLKYAIKDGIFGWQGMSELSAADLMASKKRTAPTITALDAAKAYLREALANGPRPGNELLADAKKRKIAGRSTLFEAKKALDIKAFKPSFEGEWYWQLSDEVVAEEFPRTV
jgi:hypothetical protein